MSAAGYSSRCKACNSPLRTQIEQWHTKDGDSSRIISARLKEMGEKISYRALDNHFDEHYNVATVASEQYAESQANMQVDAEARLSEIEVLDQLVAGKYALHQRLERIITNRLASLEEAENCADLPKLPMAYVSLYTGCAAEIRQVMKTKQELLGEDSGSKKAGAMQSWVDLMLEDEADE